MDEQLFSNDEIEETNLAANSEEEEYEEIDSDEVDSVVSSLEELSSTIESENIRHLIEEASNQIYFLVYSEEDLEDDEAVGEDDIIGEEEDDLLGEAA